LILAKRGQGWQGSKMQAYWLVVRILLTPPAEATASQKWKIIYLHVLILFTAVFPAVIQRAYSFSSFEKA
jgi:hypothetical protein